MELTPEEAKLIKTLRAIDEANPLGIDGYTSASVISFCLDYAAITASEAGRRYRLFLEESKRQPFVNIPEAQRSKARYEDTRASEKSKAEYEQDYKRWGMPAPVWTSGRESQKKTAARP